MRVTIAQTSEGMKVELDGKEVDGLVAIGFNSEVDDVTEVTLVVRPEFLELNLDGDPIINVVPLMERH